ncbi:MAG: hypothetical protein KJO75_09190 [Dactylosporangium sp.]|nr:hypothetical protein [Dactylosporangium sp.]
MLTELSARIAARLAASGVAERLRRLRRRPDAGMETADKILWAAVITITVSLVGAVFRDKLQAFATSLTITLGW